MVMDQLHQHTHTHTLSGCDFSLRIKQQVWPAGKQEVGCVAAVVLLFSGLQVTLRAPEERRR